MLKLILGKSGTGKTAYIQNYVADLVSSGVDDIIYIVPEQFSFETERKMLEKLGAKNNGKVHVLSFTRLSYAVFRTFGGVSGDTLNDAGRAVLMSLALENISDRLTVYKSHACTLSFAKEMLVLNKEFKQGSITPDSLAETSNRVESDLLSQKLEELSIITRTYNALLSASFVDDDEILTRLVDTLKTKDFFGGKVVVMDSFDGFTSEEFMVMEYILKQCDECLVTLTSDSLHDTQNESGTFSPVIAFGEKLRAAANKVGTRIATPIILDKPTRYKNNELYHLQAHMFEPVKDTYSDEIEHIHVVSCFDFLEECENTAREIKRLLREEEYRCRDIAVIGRSIDGKRGTIESAFEKYDVPIFRDERKPLQYQPLMVFVRSILECANYSYQTQAVLRLLKTGLTVLTVDEVSDLENYAYTWRISGRKWKEPFTLHPDGFGNKIDEKAQEKLENLNASRKVAIAPLQDFIDSTKKTSGEAIVKKLFHTLKEYEADENLKEYAIQLADDGQDMLAVEQDRVWDILMGILNQCAIALHKTTITTRRFSDFFDVALSSSTLGEIPQGIDVVTVGDAGRVRLGEKRAVFVIGANEGVFPQTPMSSGMLSDRDRRALLDLGLEVAKPSEHQTIEEQLMTYRILCTPQEELYISYARTNDADGQALPSSIVSEVKTLFPQLKETSGHSDNIVTQTESLLSATQVYADLVRDKNPNASVFRTFFMNEKERQDIHLDAMLRAADVQHHMFKNKLHSRNLFGEKMTLSATRIETYHKCKFQYFCKYGLKAYPRRRAELDPLSSGTIVHYVLEKMVQKYGGEGLAKLSDDEMQAEIKNLLHEYLETRMGGEEDKSKRFLYLFKRIGITLIPLLKHMAKEFAVSQFKPVDFELSLADKGDIEPLRIELDDGSQVKVVGKVDRVDKMSENSDAYIRIIDYKSKGKEFSLYETVEGLNIQMLLYLLSITKHGQKRYGNIVPAGVLYVRSSLPSPTLGREATAEEVEKEQATSYKASGIVLLDDTVLKGMEPSGKGEFIPVEVKGDKLKGSYITLAELNALFDNITRQIETMVETLHKGDVSAIPIRGGNFEKTCEYCDYRSVCGFEENDEVRAVKNVKDETIKEKLLGGVSDE